MRPLSASQPLDDAQMRPTMPKKTDRKLRPPAPAPSWPNTSMAQRRSQPVDGDRRGEPGGIVRRRIDQLEPGEAGKQEDGYGPCRAIAAISVAAGRHSISPRMASTIAPTARTMGRSIPETAEHALHSVEADPEQRPDRRGQRQVGERIAAPQEPCAATEQRRRRRRRRGRPAVASASPSTPIVNLGAASAREPLRAG